MSADIALGPADNGSDVFGFALPVCAGFFARQRPPQSYGVKNLPGSRSRAPTVELEDSRGDSWAGGACLRPAKDASIGFAKGSIAASGVINEDE